MRSIRLAVAVLGLSLTPAAAQHQHPAPVKTDTTGLAEQIAAVRAATERYRDFEAAKRDGYRKFGVDGPLMGEHWYHPERVKQPLDLTRPATLQYALIDGKRVLVGVAYNVYQRPEEALPEGFAGSADHWHVHDMPSLARTLVNDRPLLRRIVNRRIEQGKVGAGAGRTQLTMVHAWVWSENPDGIFAHQHRALPYLRAGLPAEWAATGDLDAAWGTSLLKDGCQREMKRLDLLAKLSDAQEQAIKRACARAAERVRAAPRTSAAAFNQAAGDAWRDLSALQDRLLTPEQKKEVGDRR